MQTHDRELIARTRSEFHRCMYSCVERRAVTSCSVELADAKGREDRLAEIGRDTSEEIRKGVRDAERAGGSRQIQ